MVIGARSRNDDFLDFERSPFDLSAISFVSRPSERSAFSPLAAR